MKLSSRYRIGIDVGGTFTDLVIWDSKNGTTKTLKTPTIPPTFADGVMAGIQQAEILADGAIMPPFGIHGGGTGAPVNSYIVKQDGTEHHFDSPGKVGGYPLIAGDTVTLQSASGGGYGDPLNRDPVAVLMDLENGLISQEATDMIYGVQFNLDGSINLEATQARRSELLAAKVHFVITRDDSSPYRESGPSKRRIIRLNPSDITSNRFSINQKIEVINKIGAPLRGWIKEDKEVKLGTIPIDILGLRSLGANPDEKIVVRPLHTPQVFYQEASLN